MSRFPLATLVHLAAIALIFIVDALPTTSGLTLLPPPTPTPPPLEYLTRRLKWTELTSKVTFDGGICPALPADRKPLIEVITTPKGSKEELSNIPAGNEGWSLVNFCKDSVCGSHLDDGSSSQSLLFNFDFFGKSFSRVYINTNGNLSFESGTPTFTSTGFPLEGVPMVAPFWADVNIGDSEDSDLGHVWKKQFSNHAYAFAWDHVGPFGGTMDQENTFMVMISDGNDATMGPGNNVCFCYEDMQWTTGGASRGVDGFGGSPATVGANAGNEIDFFQFGRYDGKY